MVTNSSTLDFIQEQLTSIREKKAADVKSAEERGNTSHPVMQSPDGTEAAPEGSRFQENTADIKKDEGPASVDSTSGTEGGGADDHQTNIGLQQAATGEDAAAEDPDKIGKKDDAPTTHPAKGSVKESELKERGNKILAKIAMIVPKEAAEEEPESEASDATAENEQKSETEEGAKKADKASDVPVKKTPKDEQPEKEAAGKDFEAGKQAAEAAAAVLNKQAEAIQEVASSIEKKAAADAEKYCDFLKGFKDGTTKKGNDDTPKDEVTDDEGQGEEEEEKDKDNGEAAGAAEEAAAVAPEVAATEAPIDAQGAIGDMLGAEEGGMPPEMMGAPPMGADPMGGAPMGADPMGGAPMGADPMGGPPMMGGEGGGGGLDQIDPETLMALLQALQAEGTGPGGMQVAASLLKNAQTKHAQRQQAVAIKRANFNRSVAFFRNQIKAIKQADEAAAPAPVV